MAIPTTSTSAMQGFSLFPTTVPKISIPNPHKKNPSLHSISIVTSPDSAFSPNAESVVIKMEEERPPLPRLPASLSAQQHTRESTPSPEDIGRAVSTTSPIDGRTPTQPVPQPSAAAVAYTPSLYQSPDLNQTSSPQPLSSLGTGSATTLVAAPAPTAYNRSMTNNKSPTDPSPIVPIRSMFPVYDPSVPITHQVYVPQPPPPVRLSGMPMFAGMPASREDYRSSLSIPFNASAIAAAQRTAPASVLNFPSDVMSINVGPRISTQRELEKLWEASHGTEPACSIKTFDLEMARTAEATFVFGSHPSLPFYTLQTYDTNEIAVSKTCPSKPRSSPSVSAESPLTRDVVLCPLEPAARRLPPNDGLVAFIFPKLAALLAINQSAALARQHSLAPTDRDEIEAQAVRRAAHQEACHLRFNAKGGFYELEHPAIGRGAMGGEFALKSPATLLSSPTTVRSMTGKPVLHVTISTDGALPTIYVIDPNASRRTGGTVMTPTTAAPSSAGAGIRRLSTLPHTEITSTGPSLEFPPLASLDLTSEILHVDANAILELMPSLFSIDCIISAILSVAVADATTNAVLGGMEIWKPRPAPVSRLGTTGASAARSIHTRAGSVKSHAGSVFYATIAEREEAEEEAKLMRRAHEADLRTGGGSSSRSGNKAKGVSRMWFGRLSSSSTANDSADEDDVSEKRPSSRRKTKNKNKNKKQIVMHEFDLEKLGHYQSGDRKGEELPAVTRGVLSGLVMGLRLIVWLLTMVVQVLAWVLVHVTRGLTSEKF
ncbi:uncharacterized protein Z520_00101 [Fonsecaea multimorphosa CBS 102226]|uniref:Uncharacterized protein n=1 Tax=Fonsecaea multimorphosa CBS 102226 TaxID=1442371 RepID=A0A0D2KIZ7_9EURO|nr:uncharacterized protein Z520_00101 [Fonsecaea multimorphosa CBS 102226]KIY03410.1 hypothetical protein Z520_00101 [Fonsecaea multimorphosa CBS 102226]OAL33059.1 hypothetical protein AYO22_00144 [Fonsecaea multimorphosa]